MMYELDDESDLTDDILSAGVKALKKAVANFDNLEFVAEDVFIAMLRVWLDNQKLTKRRRRYRKTQFERLQEAKIADETDPISKMKKAIAASHGKSIDGITAETDLNAYLLQK